MFTAQDAQLPFCQNRLQRYNIFVTYASIYAFFSFFLAYVKKKQYLCTLFYIGLVCACKSEI